VESKQRYDMKMLMHLIAIKKIKSKKIIKNLAIIICELTLPIQNYTSPT
jgi:hypothetical protein